MLKAMTDQEAETLVTAFTALCKDLVKDDAIMDERLLRASKERLYEAFDHHIARFESVRTTNPDLFYREDFDWAVDRFKTARFEIATFQTIDPEDESFVAQIWSDELEDESDEDTQKKILQIKLKYTNGSTGPGTSIDSPRPVNDPGCKCSINPNIKANATPIIR